MGVFSLHCKSKTDTAENSACTSRSSQGCSLPVIRFCEPNHFNKTEVNIIHELPRTRNVWHTSYAYHRIIPLCQEGYISFDVSVISQSTVVKVAITLNHANFSLLDLHTVYSQSF